MTCPANRSVVFSLAAAVLALAPPVFAAAPRPGAHGALEAAIGVAPVRAEISTRHGAPPAARRAAWSRFLRAARSPAWQALWDADTDAPLRIFGAGIPVPGAMAQPAVAEAAARDLLRAHLDLLAPSAAEADFDLVADDLDAGLRTVAFEQRALVAGGARVRVIGGRFSVRFKSDRLFVIAAEASAVPPLAAPGIEPAAAALAALAWTAAEHAQASLAGAPELVALPLVGSGRREVRLVYRVEIEAAGPRARDAVYVDARNGAPVARESLLRFEQANVLFDAPVRGPNGARQSYAAPRLDVTVDGVKASTDEAGSFSFTGTGAPASVDLGVRGAQVRITNAAGENALATFPGTDGADIVWSLATDELGDAQLASFTHASLIKAHARAIAPALGKLTGTLQVNPNVADDYGCDAFWDGTSVNFYRQSKTCNNAARVADVVYHEFGHAFHQYAIIAGAGALDPALGEAGADTMSASYTHDSRMAPGFFLSSDKPLRDVNTTARWPEDISFDPHLTGLIWGGAMWDLRGFLVEDLGEGPGHALTDDLYYQAIRRSSSIPTTYAEILAADDDDGDLSNGTPHVCAINRAFFAHGLMPALSETGLVLVHEPLTVVAPSDEPYPIVVSTKVLYPQCSGGGQVDAVTLTYQGGNGPEVTSILTGSGSEYKGAIGGQTDGTSLRYSVSAIVAGHESVLPDNPADPGYRVFVGATVPIYCNDFESQIDGWTFAGDPTGKGDFAWGPPAGKGGDPAAAFSGGNVIGNHLTGDGTYKAGKTAFAESPEIDLAGERHVRLQFRRWLTSEDAYYDEANVIVNGQQVWQNLATGDELGLDDHIDREWRFEDIDLTSLVTGGATTARVRFEMNADDAKERGGWNVDDFCLVAWHPAPPVDAAGSGGGSSASGTGGGPSFAPEGGCNCAAAGQGPDAGLSGFGGAALLGAIAARRARRRVAGRR